MRPVKLPNIHAVSEIEDHLIEVYIHCLFSLYRVRKRSDRGGIQ